MTLPLGTPDVISVRVELDLLINTLCCLSDRKSFIHFNSVFFQFL